MLLLIVHPRHRQQPSCFHTPLLLRDPLVDVFLQHQIDLFDLDVENSSDGLRQPLDQWTFSAGGRSVQRTLWSEISASNLPYDRAFTLPSLSVLHITRSHHAGVLCFSLVSNRFESWSYLYVGGKQMGASEKRRRG